MKIFYKILLTAFLFNLLCAEYETNDMIYEDLFEEQRRFINEQKDKFKKSKGTSKLDEKQYPLLVSQQRNLLKEIKDCDDCSSAQKSQLSYELYYNFAKNTMLRYGKMIDYKTNLDRSINILEQLLDQIDIINKSSKKCSNINAWDQYDCYFQNEIYTSDKKIDKLKDKYNKNLRSYKQERESLQNEYVDIKIYIKHPEDQKIFDDMVEVFDSKDKVNPVIITLDVPAIFYDKKFEEKFKKDSDEQRTFKNKKNRVNSLRGLSEELRLTAYDKDKGFYFKIPMVPVIPENSKRKLKEKGPEYSYAIIITSSNGVEKRRFELSTRSEKDNPFEGITIDAEKYGWEFEYNKIPFDWTKIELDDNLNFKYKDSEDVVVCTFDINRENQLILTPAFKEIFIPIYNENQKKIYIYQKDIGDLDGFKIEFSQSKRDKIKEGFKKSIKYILFALLFGAGYAQSN